MNKLIVTTTTPYSMFGGGDDVKPVMDISKYKGANIPFNTENVMVNIYLHGEIESIAEFDIPIFLDGDFPIEDGKYPVTYLPENIECTMFLWFNTSLRIHGLIVANTDTKNLAYAEEKLKEKS